ncbi:MULTISPECIES: TetR family transcriptional regulator [Arthrobacter]|uniref:TetR family transcriptional regulator n=1 Tax=Arthrobacter terricola TaxID=2547396 RepID=A0A4V2ZUH7_9MICC|nr:MULTISPECIES: TetR family transcriptional regulator [Arthrobacter]MBT8160020.1 TetR/AcrR family transcriptional regulator [Arthrobacter sp. GN70]TDG01025.1 TetR family transcriptional regulator [Arthrobacter terricola]
MSTSETVLPPRREQNNSRREQNKLATRQAIADAALALLRGKGIGNFTVEDIAEVAGVSRRTFFNYFPSLEAALAAVTEGFLDNALEQFRLRPNDEPVLESARAALMALADPMTVAPMAELFSLTQDNRSLARSELEAWDHCTTQIIGAARHRLGPEADELYLRALAGSVVSCGKAAMSVWFEERGPDLSAESLADLRQHLINAIGLLGSGFTTTADTSPPPVPGAPARQNRG